MEYQEHDRSIQQRSRTPVWSIRSSIENEVQIRAEIPRFIHPDRFITGERFNRCPFGFAAESKIVLEARAQRISGPKLIHKIAQHNNSTYWYLIVI